MEAASETNTKSTWQSAVEHGPWLAIAASVLIAWCGNGLVPLWDRDEPRFATATREMADRGDWIVPTFNGALRPDKPILIYWLMRLSYAAFGEGEFAARFFSGVGAGLSCLMVFLIGRAMFDRSTGVFAAWILALSPMLIVESKLATVDALLLSLTTTCFFAAWQTRHDLANWRWPLLYWVVMALVVLTKGPVGFAVVLGSLLLTALVTRDRQWITGLRWWGPLLAAAMILPWCVAVHFATDGEFLQLALGHHVVKRSLEPLEQHSGFPGFYLASIFLLMAPWSWHLPLAFKQCGRKLWTDPRLVFLAAWVIFPLIMFELVRTKLVHYYLPAYPALALLISAGFVSRDLGSLPGWHRLKGWGKWCGASVVALVPMACIAGGFALTHFFPPEVAVPGVLLMSFIGVMSLATGTLLWREQWVAAIRVHIAATVAAFLVIGGWLLPAVSQQRVIVAVAERLRAVSETDRVALWHYCDPSLMFNFGEVIPWIDYEYWGNEYPQARELARKHGRFLCPMTDADRDLMATDPQLRLEVVETITHFDLHGLRPKSVHLVAVMPADRIASAETTINK